MARAEVFSNADLTAVGPSGDDPSGGRWYLSYFIHRLLDFRLPDVESVAETLGCSLQRGDVAWRRPHGDEELSPFWYLRLPSEDMARQVADRAMLTRVGGTCD